MGQAAKRKLVSVSNAEQREMREQIALIGYRIWSTWPEIEPAGLPYRLI